MNFQALSFLATFAFACLVGAIAYLLARRPSPLMRWVQRGLSFLSLCLLFLFLPSGVLNAPIPILLFAVLMVGASGLQALLERPLQIPALTPQQSFIRALLSYLCTIALLSFLAALFIAWLAAAVTRPGPSSVPTWLLQFSVGRYGFYGGLAGWLLAPLTISFCRLLFQSTQLRPGLDRALRDEELT